MPWSHRTSSGESRPMLPYRPYLATATPQTLEVRLEIAKALQALAAQDGNMRLQERRRAAASMRRELEEIMLSVQELRRACDARLRSCVIKYSPDQPRVPAGNPDGGQWTGEDGSGSSNDASNAANDDAHANDAGTQYAAPDTRTRTDAAPGESSVQVAASTGLSRSPVDLREEENLGGHAISEHVGKSDAELLEQMEQRTLRLPLVSQIDRREGSFASVEIANDLVNRALDAPENESTVSDVAVGKVRGNTLVTFHVDSVTGREWYRADPDAEPQLRTTDGIGVVIRYDPNSPRGFRVITAYPRRD